MKSKRMLVIIILCHILGSHGVVHGQLTLIETGGSMQSGPTAGELNMALSVAGAIPFWKDDLTDFDPLLTGYEGDKAFNGTYANAGGAWERAWISDTADSFVGVALSGPPATIDRVAFGTDNSGNSTEDREAGTWTLQYTTVANPDETTPDASWTTIGTVTKTTNDTVLRGLYQFTAVTGVTGVRLTTTVAGNQVDELEVYAAASAPPDFSQWSNKAKITFSGYTGTETLSNFPALVILGPGISGFNYSQFASGTGGDLRFSAADGTTELPYEIERWDTGGDSYVWVRVPQLSGTGTEIWAYWGNGSAGSPPAPLGTWSEKFAAVWHMDETSGAVVDSSGNPNTGTAVGTVNQNTSGIIDGANTFDSVDDVITVEDHDSLEANPRGLTLESWVFPIDNHSPDFGDIIFKSGAYEMYVSAGTLHSRLYAPTFTYVGGAALTISAWNYVAMTYDGANAKVYVNGVEMVNDTSQTGDIPETFDQVGIGNYNYAGANFHGPIDEVRISSTARSADWLWASYMNQSANGTFNTYGAIQTTSVPTGSASVVIFK